MAVPSFPEQESDSAGGASAGDASAGDASAEVASRTEAASVGVDKAARAEHASVAHASVAHASVAGDGDASVVGSAEAEARGDEILREARSWIGTPYVHQASRKGAGCDCLGLIRGIWREVVGVEPEIPPHYSPDWGEVGGRELLLAAAFRRLRPAPEGGERIGDVILFRWRPGGLARHAGILAPGGKVIHAWEEAGVVEVTMPPAWRRRIAGFFRYPTSRYPASRRPTSRSPASQDSASRSGDSRTRDSF